MRYKVSGIKYLIFTLSLVILNTLYLILCTKPAQAFTMSNGNWIIRMGEFNTAGGQAENKNNKLTSTVGQTSANLYTGKNYKAKGGFLYVNPIASTFSFSLSENLINFGLLTATNPVIRTSTLTVNNASSPGYQVIAYEDHPLINANNISIPDTTCDNGSCSETTSATWTSTLTYGFGYRCDPINNITCSSIFSEPNSYRKFSNLSKNESPQTVIIGSKTGKNRKAKITYKVNISGTQMTGIYKNSIIYIAAPTY